MAMAIFFGAAEIASARKPIKAYFCGKITPKTIHIQIRMELSTKIKSFAQLGKFLSQFRTEIPRKNNVPYNEKFFEGFEALIKLSQSHNGWYTLEQVRFAVASWADALAEENLSTWLSRYDIEAQEPKTVGLVLAGNIPLVGFHDFLSVLMSGHKALVKLSSNDQKLLPFLASYLIAIEPEFSRYIEFTERKLENFDAVIATGSNNTARYFEYYFRDKPSIIRKNRNSAAVLTGSESPEQLIKLGEDIFRYFGLGCRNVSKIFVPRDYDFQTLFGALYEYRDVINYEKYANNYDYNKAVFLMSNFKLLDNGFLTLKEDSGYASPISSVFYEFYDDIDQLKQRLDNDADQLQCIVSDGLTENSIEFGQTQKPQLWDYADGIDTMEFLLRLP